MTQNVKLNFGFVQQPASSWTGLTETVKICTIHYFASTGTDVTYQGSARGEFPAHVMKA
jgi:hypothetical protein